MIAYIVRRTILAIVTIWSITVLAFVIIQLPPGDFLTHMIIQLERQNIENAEELVRGTRALMADASGTLAGACLGTSTVTAYIESSSGVAMGARTGLANVVTGVLFLLALFVSPLVRSFGG